MEGTAFSIDEASFDASLLPDGSRTPGTEEFHRAVTDYVQRSYAGMGGQLSTVTQKVLTADTKRSLLLGGALPLVSAMGRGAGWL